MSYVELLLAHGAFYKYEIRAKEYDEYLSKKHLVKWTAGWIDLDVVYKLFDFIWKWDRFFKRDDKRFVIVFQDIHAIFNSINNYEFNIFHLNYNEIMSKISQIFNRVALYYDDDDAYQSTDASKILHAINPALYIMWDSNIREGILGHNDNRYAHDYSEYFIPTMIKKFREIVKDFIIENNATDSDFYDFVSDASDGKSITKLLDQLNYMTYTMPTYFSAYKKEVESLFLNYKEMDMSKKRDFWINLLPRNQYRNQKLYAYFISLLNRARNKTLISAKERREINSKWFNNLEDKEYLINRLEQLIKQNE